MMREEAVSTNDIEHISFLSDYLQRSCHDDNDNELRHERLFTADKDFLSGDEVEHLKKCFDIAQNNKSNMWQTVISFDNEWLESNGLYNSESGAVDVHRLHELTRKHMNVMLDEEQLMDSTVWTASIHYNTAHTHIHIAAVEPCPTRAVNNDDQYKGKFSKKSIFKAKSAVVNDIINQSEQSKMINDIIRNKIIADQKKHSMFEDAEMDEKFTRLLDMLPGDKRLWKYNNNAIKEYRPLVDELSKMFIEKYHKDDYAELNKLLTHREEQYRNAYGKSDKFGSYTEKKIQDLYSRMGNTILRELREYDKLKKESYLRNTKGTRRAVNGLAKYRNQSLINSSIRKLIGALNDNYEHYKNQQRYEELEREAEIRNSDYADY